MKRSKIGVLLVAAYVAFAMLITFNELATASSQINTCGFFLCWRYFYMALASVPLLYLLSQVDLVIIDSNSPVIPAAFLASSLIYIPILYVFGGFLENKFINILKKKGK